jgi:hypothetical protein
MNPNAEICNIYRDMVETKVAFAKNKSELRKTMKLDDETVGKSIEFRKALYEMNGQDYEKSINKPVATRDKEIDKKLIDRMAENF